MSAPVFLADADADLSAVRPGGTFVLGGAEGRHAAVVQRRHAGERVDVVDGRGTRLLGVVVEADRDGLVLRVEDVVVEPAPGVRLVLVQALAKGDRDDLAIEAATELGVDAVVPWQSERSVVVWRGDRATKAHAKWVSTVRAAAKQARRARVPDVEQVVDGKALVRLAERTVSDGGAVLVLHEDATTTWSDAALPTPGIPGMPSVLVVVGPEGGISDDEVERLVAVGAQVVVLGPHVLRTSTAGPTALALLCERLGRWA
ncbi:16S rRNA (uracil(1498)-N(3))-methyltransferase [Luteimicrobium subarcticum]|uniref:Ribosomal RNA small subunit methyltransferase E n=1 Tax=Luteimicrobium subarcticum TaxID=620910 RepID=A0A2M8WR07_9MICO|nr:16S rRNA (uracil(1498)-N(3))-methyltransferase [Luteimicrobium subarcticum]PJI93357.1 16S rRNA (uracil1498-N3)-methyltransferase [Luteimicrobium subarcticum]